MSIYIDKELAGWKDPLFMLWTYMSFGLNLRAGQCTGQANTNGFYRDFVKDLLSFDKPLSTTKTAQLSSVYDFAGLSDLANGSFSNLQSAE